MAADGLPLPMSPTLTPPSPPQLSPSSSPTRRTAFFWTAGWLVLFGFLSYSAALQKSATFDEPLHAVSGAVLRQTGDYRVDSEDPALFTFLSAIPHGSGALRIDTNSPAFQAIPYEHNRQWNVVIDTLYRTPGNDGVAYVNQSRFLFMLIGIALGGLIAWWAYRIAGPAAAMIAVAIFSLDPNFLAHASLVKNDVLTALLMLWLTYSLWLIGQRITGPRIACVALCCAAAINIKFSGVIFGPITAVALFTRALLPWPWKIWNRELKNRRIRLATSFVICGLLAITSWAGTWMIYSADKSPEAAWLPLIRDIKIRTIAVAGAAPPTIKLGQLDALPDPTSVKILAFLNQHHVLPHSWLTGLLYTYDSTIARGSYLLGKHSISGWWYYFPLTMLFKTPLTILALMAAMIVLWCIRLARSGTRPHADWTIFCLWLPIVIYGASTLTTHLNLGLRHILPVYPFIYLLIATSLAGWLRNVPRIVKPAIGILLLTLALESFSAWPDYIPFFNIASGGTTGGYRLLGDSNLDWGQDLPLLAAWQQDHRGTLLYFCYFGTADPAYYGIVYINGPKGFGFSPESTHPPDRPGVFAISATTLQGIYFSRTELAQMQNLLLYLRGREPMVRLGGSIYLYDWQPADFAAFVAKQPP